MTPDEDKKSELSINKKHLYFYQLQGQLHMYYPETNYVFGIWTEKGIKIDRINYDKNLCKTMVQKLEKFNKICVLPELVDLRGRRSLVNRNPDYILKAQRERERKT